MLNGVESPRSCAVHARDAPQTPKGRGVSSAAFLVVRTLIVRGELRDDLNGLVQRGKRDRREQGASGDQGIELGHRDFLSGLRSDDLGGLVQRGERDRGHHQSGEDEAEELGADHGSGSCLSKRHRFDEQTLPAP